MDSAWECECGNVEYGEVAPEECEKCFGINSFAQLPDELIEERTKEMDDLEVQNTSKMSKSTKAKKKTKSGKRKK
jgi:hypothetical protein